MEIAKKSDHIIPANWVSGAKQGEWTYDDYLKIPDDGRRYEIRIYCLQR